MSLEQLNDKIVKITGMHAETQLNSNIDIDDQGQVIAFLADKIYKQYKPLFEQLGSIDGSCTTCGQVNFHTKNEDVKFGMRLNGKRRYAEERNTVTFELRNSVSPRFNRYVKVNFRKMDAVVKVVDAVMTEVLELFPVYMKAQKIVNAQADKRKKYVRVALSKLLAIPEATFTEHEFDGHPYKIDDKSVLNVQAINDLLIPLESPNAVRFSATVINYHYGSGRELDRATAPEIKTFAALLYRFDNEIHEFKEQAQKRYTEEMATLGKTPQQDECRRD